MTYEESYIKCNSEDEILAEVQKDISLAMIINPEMVRVIKEAAEKVLNLKFRKNSHESD